MAVEGDNSTDTSKVAAKAVDALAAEAVEETDRRITHALRMEERLNTTLLITFHQTFSEK